MARMSVDDKFLRDPRVAVLGKLCGWSVRETRGALLDVWAVCYDQVTALVSRAMIDVAADLDGFSDKLIEAELGVLDRSGKVRVVGASDRIEYLDHKRKAGRQGGLNSAKVRSKEVKQTSSTVGSNSQALGNPIPTVTVTASATDTALEERPLKRGRTNKHRLAEPDTFVPERSEANLEAEKVAEARGVNLRVELLKLRDWARSSGEKRSDWQAVWRNWTRNAKPVGGGFKAPTQKLKQTAPEWSDDIGAHTPDMPTEFKLQ